MRALVQDGRKLVRDDRDHQRLYDLSVDPAEVNPLDDAEWAPKLRDAADAWLRSRVPSTGDAPGLDAEQLESLRALGYME